MNPRQLAALAALTLGSGVTAWLVMPRPDTVIVVRRGGVAEVRPFLGPARPLADTLRVGGTGARRRVRVINEDTVPHRLSLLRVGAGETSDYTVPRGTFGGSCSAHPGRQLVIQVE